MAHSGVELAKPFVKATINVLSTMAMIEPKPGKPYIKKGETAVGDVSAIIGFTGEHKGTISVSFSKECAVTMVKNMLGDDIEDIMQDAKDAVGEVANMISGQARAGLAEMGLTFLGSTPTVITGDKHTVSHMTKSPIIVIPFTTDHGNFAVEFSFEQE